MKEMTQEEIDKIRIYPFPYNHDFNELRRLQLKYNKIISEQLNRLDPTPNILGIESDKKN
jgi:hypothetical protein